MIKSSDWKQASSNLPPAEQVVLMTANNVVLLGYCRPNMSDASLSVWFTVEGKPARTKLGGSPSHWTEIEFPKN